MIAMKHNDSRDALYTDRRRVAHARASQRAVFEPRYQFTRFSSSYWWPRERNIAEEKLSGTSVHSACCRLRHAMSCCRHPDVRHLAFWGPLAACLQLAGPLDERAHSLDDCDRCAPQVVR